MIYSYKGEKYDIGIQINIHIILNNEENIIMNINKFCKILSMGSPKTQQRAIKNAKKSKFYSIYTDTKEKINNSYKFPKFNSNKEEKNQKFDSYKESFDLYDEGSPEYTQICNMYKNQLFYVRQMVSSEIKKLKNCGKIENIKFDKAYEIEENSTSYIWNSMISISIFKYAKDNNLNARSEEAGDAMYKICHYICNDINQKIKNKYPEVNLTEEMGDWDDFAINIVIRK